MTHIEQNMEIIKSKLFAIHVVLSATVHLRSFHDSPMVLLGHMVRLVPPKPQNQG